MTAARRLAILAPVWPAYAHVSASLREQVTLTWESQPPLLFCGAMAGWDIAACPSADGAAQMRASWPQAVLEGVRHLRADGYSHCYLICEEHLPIGRCNAPFLNVTLPQTMERLGGVYCSLMGWDNRRYLKRGTCVGGTDPGLLRLDTPDAPRFHLHPALWRMDALTGCLENAVAQGAASAWAFEKLNEKWQADLPETWKRGCYQIEGRRHAHTPSTAAALAGILERKWFHFLMRFYPFMAALGVGRMFWRVVGFDRFAYQGPYPMYFSGVMAKGGINAACIRHLLKRPETRSLARQLLEESHLRSSPPLHERQG